MVWSYKVKGTFPLYKTPTVVENKLNNKLSHETKRKMRLTKSTKRNFLLANIERAPKPSKKTHNVWETEAEVGNE